MGDWAMQIVSPARFLDGAVFAIFLLFVSGLGLFLFGQFHKFIVITEAQKLGPISTAVDQLFPFPKQQYSFNLTHTILFAILVSLLAMIHHPVQDLIQKEAEKKEKAKKSK